MTHRLHVVVEGRVQGVGYRYSAGARARAAGLNGWVRNRPDGSVEAEFEGPRALLEEMLDWCREGPAFARVTRVEPRWESGEKARYTSFSIRF